MPPRKTTTDDPKRHAKPLDDLKPQDFERFPLWGFDSSIESEPGLDETAVTPQAFARVPRESDVLFVGAHLVTASGRKLAGTVRFCFSKGRPSEVGLSLLAPYRALEHDDRNRIDQNDSTWTYAKTGHSGLQACFPLRYEARFEVGGKAFELAATLTLKG